MVAIRRPEQSGFNSEYLVEYYRAGVFQRFVTGSGILRRDFQSSEIELDIIQRLKEYGEEIKVEGISTYIEGHGQVNILSISLNDENRVFIHLSDRSTIGVEYLDGLQLLRVYDCIVYA